jgi:hypothetical protein
MPQAVKYKLILAVQPVHYKNLIIYSLIFLLGMIFSKNAMQIRSVSAQSKCLCRTFLFTNRTVLYQKYTLINTVCFTDLDQGREILS